MSTFHGLEIARRGIHTQQKAIHTTGHNIANANTPGYSRQRVNMSATNPLYVPALNRPTHMGQIGTGVKAGSIERIREKFLDDQFRNEASSYGSWNVRKDTLEKIEMIVDEPGQTGLQSVIDDFWNAWQDLSTEPDSMSARNVVREKAQAILDAFQHADTKLTELSQDLQTNLDHLIGDATFDPEGDEIKGHVNQTIDQIAELNEKIRRVEAREGQSANDLRDQRDLLLDDLARKVNIDVIEHDNGNGMVDVKIPGGGENGEDIFLVQGMDTTFIVQGDEVDEGAVHYSNLTIAGGEIHGIQHALDDIIPTYQGQLNDMLQGLVLGEMEVHLPEGSMLVRELTDEEKANNDIDVGQNYGRGDLVPEGGITLTVSGINGMLELGWAVEEEGEANSAEDKHLFTLVGDELLTSDNFSIQDLQINASIQANAGNIAASLRAEGNEVDGYQAIAADGEMALLIGQLRDTDIQFPEGEESSFNEYYRSMLGRLGVETEAAQRQTAQQESIMQSVEERRQSVSGVSLDEEMSMLIQFQHAYNASARTMTTIDQMLDTIINGMGIVGR